MAGEAGQKKDNSRHAPWSCQTGQDTSRTPKHERHCTVPVPVAACGFSGTVRKCSSLVAFEIHNDSMVAVVTRLVRVEMVMAIAILSATG
ncbi:hypothetical protein OIU79_026239 [Salix purpurea]|uniref:Uncharacterized protein n=1 Tax=Salix purpurea TaxID=77065 RepID=A0A9Q0VTD6_SALPP|nr:hypothetical protein OIU79_026239 [Salix purpurea]